MTAILYAVATQFPAAFLAIRSMQNKKKRRNWLGKRTGDVLYLVFFTIYNSILVVLLWVLVWKKKLPPMRPVFLGAILAGPSAAYLAIGVEFKLQSVDSKPTSTSMNALDAFRSRAWTYANISVITSACIIMLLSE
jgi:hypothetical protein